MKKILLVLMCCLIPSIASAHFITSPCDGKQVLIHNYSQEDFTITQINTKHDSSIEPFRMRMQLPKGQYLQGQVYSQGTLGRAAGTIELLANGFIYQRINLHYACLQVIPPFLSYKHTSVDNHAEGLSAYGHVENSQFIFDIYSQ